MKPSAEADALGEGAIAASAVDWVRLLDRHQAMAEIGGIANGGVCRLALSAEEAQARALLADWALERGFGCTADPAGNMFIRREGAEPGTAPVLGGSHLDSQPTGGRFDGTFGVLAALEALEAMEDVGLRTRRPVEVAVWSNEEGCRFIPGCTGSGAFRERSLLPAALALRDPRGTSYAEAVETMRAALPQVGARPLGGEVAAYVEAHIEQGPLLEVAGVSVGVVTGIQGMKRFEVTVRGEEGHAGTTPHHLRKDAFDAAVRLAAALSGSFHDCMDEAGRFTIGRFDVHPNAPSVIPARVFFTIDLRHPDKAVLDRFEEKILDICSGFGGTCAIEVVSTADAPPVEFDGIVMGAILRACERLGITCMKVSSGAMHDAWHVAHIAPSAMIFIPCEKGISHHVAENAQPQHIFDGARALAFVLAELAGAPARDRS